MKIIPLYDYVLVKRTEVEDMVNGLFIPETAKEKPQKGEVIEVGSGRILNSGELASLSLMQGDKVLFGKYSGNEIEVDNQKYLLIRENEILARIEG